MSTITYSYLRRPALFNLAIVPMGWRNASEAQKFRWVANLVYQDTHFDPQFIGERIKNISEYKCVYTFHYVHKYILQNYVEVCVNGNEVFEIPIKDVEELD
jgi:hypothetical protein